MSLFDGNPEPLKLPPNATARIRKWGIWWPVPVWFAMWIVGRRPEMIRQMREQYEQQKLEHEQQNREANES